MLFGQEHVDTYRQTAGQEGYDWQGTTVLILTTKGRRSGEPRDAPLIFAERDGDYVIVASRGGSDAMPAWWLNLQAHPATTVQIGRERLPVVAREATTDEKARLWPRLVELYSRRRSKIPGELRVLPTALLVGRVEVVVAIFRFAVTPPVLVVPSVEPEVRTIARQRHVAN